MHPRRERLLVIAPIMIEGYAVFNGDPSEVIFHNVGLLDRKEDKRFEQSSSPMKTLFSVRFGEDHAYGVKMVVCCAWRRGFGTIRRYCTVIEEIRGRCSASVGNGILRRFNPG